MIKRQLLSPLAASWESVRITNCNALILAKSQAYLRGTRLLIPGLMGKMRVRVHSSGRTAIALGHGLLQSPPFGGVMHGIYARDKLGVKRPIMSCNAFCSRHGLQRNELMLNHKDLCGKNFQADSYSRSFTHRKINTWLTERLRCLCENLDVTG